MSHDIDEDYKCYCQRKDGKFCKTIIEILHLDSRVEQLEDTVKYLSDDMYKQE